MKRPFFTLAVGFVLGEVLALQGKMAGITALAKGLAAFMAVCAAVYFLMMVKGRGLKWLLPFCAAVICGLLGFWRTERNICLLDSQEQWVQERTGTVTVSGFLDKMETSGNGWELWITEVRDERGIKGPDRLLVRMENLEQGEKELKIGRKVEVSGYLEPFEKAGNPGEFDARLYYFSQNITGQIKGKTCQAADEGETPFRNFLLGLRRTWSSLLETVCPPKEAGLFQSALLGEKKRLDPEIRTLYQKSGIAHLLAISGLHLSILGMGLYKGLRKAGASIETGAAISAVLVLSYGELIGAFGSTKRAIFMMLCAFFADVCRRTYDPLTALGLAAVWITWNHPYQILQSGFQLSFGAVLGICLLKLPEAPEKKGKKAEKKGLAGMGVNMAGSIKKGLSVSLAVQAATLPVVAFHFFRLPMYGIWLNLIVIPLMTYVLYSGMAGIGAGSLQPAAGSAVLWLGCRIFQMYEQLSQWVLSLPGNSFLTGRPDWKEIGLYYGCLLAGWYAAKRNSGRRLLVLAAAAVFGPFILRYQPPQGLTVTFLDVGQGDGIVLQTDNAVVLIDGGSTDEKSLGSQTLTPFLESRAADVIDYAIVSHGDADHISGLRYLLEEQTIRVSNLLLPAHGRGQEVYTELEHLAKAQNGQVCYIGQGDAISGKELRLTCLYPPLPEQNRSQIEEKNDHSLVIAAEYQDFSMILTGDLGSKGEEAMLSQVEVLEAEVLKAGHHGSKESSSQLFLETVRPDIAVISCGRDNSYGHPHKETIERLETIGAKIWITSESGAFELQTDGERLEMDPFLSESAVQKTMTTHK